MNLRTIKYYIGEALVNTYRNKYMSIASIIIITSTLFLFGVYFVFAINIKHNIENSKKQPDIQVFLDVSLNEVKALKIMNQIKEIDFVEDVKFVTKEAAFKTLYDNFGEEDRDLLEEVTPDFLPYSIVVGLSNSSQYSDFKEIASNIKGVDSIEYSELKIEFFNKILTVARYLGIYLTTLLVAISVMIIVNTIKLAVMSRKREISIMKYIGATNWFIRWPFIIEGILIGTFGATVSYFVIDFFYNNMFLKKFVEFGNIAELVSSNELRHELIAIFLIFGIVIGALGSGISVRKYLRV